jgi:Ca-activated chloride channel family protein
MHFESPKILWLLLVIPPVLAVFFAWSLRERARLLAQFIHTRLLENLVVGVSPQRLKLRFGLAILAVALLIFTLARPQHGFELEQVEQRGLDIVVAVDTSKSMLATDIAPNRLTRAKLAALELMQKATTDRLGLVAFAGDAFLECPLTTDNTAFQQSVQELDVNTIPQGGTALREAINTALTAFKEKGRFKAMVLLTDGEDNDTGAVEAAQAAAKAGMKIFTVGIGTTEGDLLDPNLVRDENGNAVKSHLNEALLQQIAQITGGFYVPLRGAAMIDALYDRGLSGITQGKGNEKVVRRYHEWFQWPLGLAILVLLAEFFFPERVASRRGAKPPAMPAAALLVFAALLAGSHPVQATPAEALHYYREGNYTNAIREYERLAETDTNDLRLVFNAGDAAYRATNFDEAVKDFKWVTLSPDLRLQQAAFYNLGNTQFRQGQLAKDLDGMQTIWEEAITNYSRAVQLNRQDTNAAANLAFVQAQVDYIKEFRLMILRASEEAHEAVRRRSYHRALEIMAPLEKTVVAKKYEDYIKKLKDIDAIVTPPQPGAGR